MVMVMQRSIFQNNMINSKPIIMISKVNYNKMMEWLRLMKKKKKWLKKVYFIIFSIIIVENERKWFWAFPQIEGVPPCPRGGHSATLIGASILYFGVLIYYNSLTYQGHYYGGKKTGYTYLNDTHVLDLNSSRWIKPKI